MLLTHDHHGDNLDAAGRALLPDVPAVVTTVSGARRLGLAHAIGLRPGATTTLRAAGLPDLEVRATPARHGPPLTRPIVGDVIGFALRRAGDDGVFLWVTGDTVLHRPLRAAAAAMRVDVALVHVGGVRFPITGPVRYTMTATRGGASSASWPGRESRSRCTTRAGRTSRTAGPRSKRPWPPRRPTSPTGSAGSPSAHRVDVS